MRQVYLWMAVGLLLTAGMAAFVTASPLMAIVTSNSFLLFGLLIVEVVLVFGISLGINRLSPTVAVGLFLLDAALNGVTLALIFAVYTLGSIALAAVADCRLVWGDEPHRLHHPGRLDPVRQLFPDGSNRPVYRCHRRCILG